MRLLLNACYLNFVLKNVDVDVLHQLSRDIGVHVRYVPPETILLVKKGIFFLTNIRAFRRSPSASPCRSSADISGQNQALRVLKIHFQADFSDL